MANEDIIFFLHLPKTAGTTLSDLLISKFEQSERLHIMPLRYDGPLLENVPYDVVKWSDYEAKMAEPDTGFAPYKLVWGHIYYNPPPFQARNLRYITVLRDPIERYISNYLHNRRNDDNALHAIARELTLEEYIEHEHVQKVTSNNMVSYISNMKKGDAGLEIAKRNLEKLDVVGLTEYFEETVFLLHYAFDWPLRYKIKFLNTNRREMKYADIPAETIARIKELNKFDVALYDYGAELFHQSYLKMVKKLLKQHNG